MNKKNKIKAIVALAVALAFLMPGAAAFANVGTIGVISNSENTDDIEIMVESTNSDDNYNTDTTTTLSTLGTIYVDDDNTAGPWDGTPENPFQYIQDGVDNAIAGNTVYVYNGMYTESDILVDKSLNLIGESKEGVIVDSSGGSAYCSSFKLKDVSNTNISNFTMKNGMMGIQVECDGTDVEHINITNCITHDNQYYGIRMVKGGTYARNSVIKNCEVYNTLHGIHLFGFFDGTISECNLHDNDYGLYISGNALNNYIYHNNFIGNTQNGCPSNGGPGAIWDNGYPSGGNYWDDFDEPDEGAYDNDGDGIVDSPYILDADEEDRYPLMSPTSNLPPYTPSNPNPTEGETHVSVDADLNWTGGDPNGDPVTYNVYFGTNSPPPQVEWNQSATTYDPGPMDPEQKYYWQIVAWDNHSAFTEGPIWNFTTTGGDLDPPVITGVTLTNSIPIDTKPGFGWEKVTCTVTDNAEVDTVQLNITYPDLHTEVIPMTETGVDVYSCETTLTDVGDYTYHVWADDISGNSAESTPKQTFALPPNWDIVDLEDRECYFYDLGAVVATYGDTGSPGWIREDVDNDGEVYFYDLGEIVLMYGETW